MPDNCTNGHDYHCTEARTCSCFCHQGETRPGVPPPDAPHFVRHDLKEEMATAMKRAWVRGMGVIDIILTVNDAMRDSGIIATESRQPPPPAIPPPTNKEPLPDKRSGIPFDHRHTGRGRIPPRQLKKRK